MGFRIGPNDLLAQCLARPKGTAQIWFGPLPPCALDTWQLVTCWCFSELGELGFCDKLMISWPHIQFHTGNVLGSWWLIVAVAHSCILWLALICTCPCVFLLMDLAKWCWYMLQVQLHNSHNSGHGNLFDAMALQVQGWLISNFDPQHLSNVSLDEKQCWYLNQDNDTHWKGFKCKCMS